MGETYFNNGVGHTVVDRREGGPGNNWEIVDLEGSMVDTSSGGRRDVKSEFRQSAFGQLEYIGTQFTGNPARWTFDLMTRLRWLTFLRGALNDGDQRLNCACEESGIDIRVRERCGDKMVLTNYDMIRNYMDAYSTSDSFDKLADFKEGVNDLAGVKLSMSAGIGYSYKKLVHLNISNGWTALAINRVQYRCGHEWWACTNGVAATSPGTVMWSLDDGATFGTDGVDVFANGSDVTDIVFSGEYVIVASGAEAPAYARIEDVKAGLSSIWTLSTGITTNFPSKLAVTPDGTIWGTGAGGRVWKSDDVFTWSLVDAGTVSSSDMNAIAVANNDLVWFGGVGGDLMRWYKGVLSAVAVSGLSDDITALSVPSLRDEIYLGTDAGDIYRSRNSSANTPTFAVQSFPGAGSGVISDMKFAGFKGDVLYILQTTADPYSRVLRDLSGGALGRDVEIVGTYQDPANAGFSSIAMANQNIGLVVGAVSAGDGYIGKVSAF